jgi:hypothetical protein
LARWLSDLEELVSDRFTEILSRDTHPELVAVQRSIGTLSHEAAALPSRAREDDLVELGRKARMNQLPHLREAEKAKKKKKKKKKFDPKMGGLWQTTPR